MEKKQKMLEMRSRLDKALTSHDLVNEEAIKSLVKDQFLRSPFHGTEEDMNNIVEKRTREVSNFLQMLRSASGDEKKGHNASHNEWKVKQDSEQIRVMYREGPHGSPFHTLLAEGYVDGPTDVCLCVSWETTLYKKWWPQYTIPPFKIITSSCLQKVRIGEDISLVRVKVPWPVSDREALLHYVEIEYFKEDIVFVLINTISNTQDIDPRTHGFTKDGIPEAKDIVRVDLVGGFVLQKVSSNRSYFRTIANLDVKLDFVPPALINFVARQLVGNGFKLYQKAVGSVGATDKDYQQALEEPMYVRIRECLESHKKPKTMLVGTNGEEPSTFPLKEQTVRTYSPVVDNDTLTTEIVEEEPEQRICSDKNHLMNGFSTNLISRDQNIIKAGGFISHEVESALGILEKAISIIQEHGSLSNQSAFSSVDLKASCLQNGGMTELSNKEMASNEARGRPAAENSRFSDEVNHHVEGQNQKSTMISPRFSYMKATTTVTQPSVLDGMNKVCDEVSLKANGSHHSIYGGGKLKKSRKKSWRICCISVDSF